MNQIIEAWEAPLGELSFTEGEKLTRPPFSEDWIITRLLATGALGGLNGQARAPLLGMINTGYRPSEGAALTGETIRLDCDVSASARTGRLRVYNL